MPTISYAITACNEHAELDRLLKILDTNIRDVDEVVIQLDINATKEVKDIAKNYIEFPLNKDFASFKNNLSKHCTKEYIFQIDADEYPSERLIQILPAILDYNNEIDIFLIARINTVLGITVEHIKKWGWRYENERVNFPDYQWRIWKNNGKIKWINKVHERLDGFEKYSMLPMEEDYCLYHPKTIEKQEKQNQFYNTL